MATDESALIDPAAHCNLPNPKFYWGKNIWGKRRFKASRYNAALRSYHSCVQGLPQPTAANFTRGLGAAVGDVASLFGAGGGVGGEPGPGEYGQDNTPRCRYTSM